MVQVSAWTDDRVTQLTKLWGEGYSCAQIAAAMGEATRNAVIGKVHRLGLSRDSILVRKDAPRAPRKRKEPKARIHSNPFEARWQHPKPPPAEPIEIRCAAVEPLHLAEPVTGLCKYPYGDGPFTFCGHDAPETTYCELHHELCHKPSRSNQGRTPTPQEIAALRRFTLPASIVLNDWEAA